MRLSALYTRTRLLQSPKILVYTYLYMCTCIYATNEKKKKRNKNYIYIHSSSPYTHMYTYVYWRSLSHTRPTTTPFFCLLVVGRTTARPTRCLRHSIHLFLLQRKSHRSIHIRGPYVCVRVPCNLATSHASFTSCDPSSLPFLSSELSFLPVAPRELYLHTSCHPPRGPGTAERIDSQARYASSIRTNVRLAIPGCR